MQGLLDFPSLEQAIRAGFKLYDRTPWGYIMRGETPGGWALAIVRTRNGDRDHG
jgi:hypothetical protein